MTEPHIFIAVMTIIAAISGVTMWSRYQARKGRTELEQERTKQIEAQEVTEQKKKNRKLHEKKMRQETLRAAFDALKERADSSQNNMLHMNVPFEVWLKPWENKIVLLWEKQRKKFQHLAQKDVDRVVPLVVLKSLPMQMGCIR